MVFFLKTARQQAGGHQGGGFRSASISEQNLPNIFTYIFLWHFSEMRYIVVKKCQNPKKRSSDDLLFYCFSSRYQNLEKRRSVPR